ACLYKLSHLSTRKIWKWQISHLRCNKPYISIPHFLWMTKNQPDLAGFSADFEFILLITHKHKTETTPDPSAVPLYQQRRFSQANHTCPVPLRKSEKNGNNTDPVPPLCPWPVSPSPRADHGDN